MPDQDEPKGFTVTDRRTVTADGGPTTPEPPSASPAPATPAEARPAADSQAPMPHVDFTMFAMSLASSVLIHLGELAPPGEDGPRPNLALAKQTIDIIGMLQDKTRGNLSDEEARLLEHLLFDLRLKYVDARKRR